VSERGESLEEEGELRGGRVVKKKKFRPKKKSFGGSKWKEFPKRKEKLRKEEEKRKVFV